MNRTDLVGLVGDAVAPELGSHAALASGRPRIAPLFHTAGVTIRTGRTAAQLVTALDWAAGRTVLAPVPAERGAWVGAPSAVVHEGTIHLAYRLRRPVGQGRGFANVVATWSALRGLQTEAVLDRDRYAAESLERPCLLRTDDGRWRLYLSCATPDSKHWRVDVLEAPTIPALAQADPVTVLPGDRHTAVKDPVIVQADGGWHLWASCHPLDDPAATDRMTTEYATSPDGLDWTWRGTALAGSPGTWDARGVRFSAVVEVSDGFLAFYDGRATALENWAERTGAATAPSLTGPWRPLPGPVFASPHDTGGLRYLSLVADAAGGLRFFYESARADGSHELRTALIADPPQEVVETAAAVDPGPRAS